MTKEASKVEEQEEGQQAPIEFAEFLEATPPGGVTAIEMPSHWQPHMSRFEASPPEIQLHCGAAGCGGPRFFYCLSKSITVSDQFTRQFLNYECRNCGKTTKVFALLLRRISETEGKAYKFGELPPFGPPVSSKVIALVGPDRELFIRGRRAENLGLGIGAFAYYRRVIENQWQRIVDEIIKVGKRIGASDAVITSLENAKKETQFSKAVESAKPAIPDVLKIDGHNPLTLLHKALSEGLHDRTEEECLGLASSIRVVMSELAERMGVALKDERELKDAVSRLLNRNRK